MIYIVMGTTGEYSGRNEWPVKAYRDSRLAESHVTNATELAKIIEVQYLRYDDTPLDTNPYDPHMQMRYTGTSYFIMEVELDESNNGLDC